MPRTQTHYLSHNAHQPMAQRPDELTRQIAARLRTERMKRGLSQAQLAERTEGAVSQRQIFSYEAGRCRPPIEAAWALADALETLTAAHLLCLDLRPGSSAAVSLPESGRRVTVEQFIERARAVHGDRFDYRCTRTHWVNTKTNVAIDCPLHGRFEQHPQSHLRGAGCPECGREQGQAALRLDVEQVQWRVAERWPTVALDDATFSDSGSPAQWQCRRHGVSFAYAPVNLFERKGHPCPKCRLEEEQRERKAQRIQATIDHLVRHVEAEFGRHSAAIYRRWLEGWRLREIGAERGITGQAVAGHLKRIDAWLRACGPCAGDDETVGG
jgi:transcriptional regulator with XRE-family HTH domain